MPCYRTYPFPDSKWFLTMGVRCFTDALFNHFKVIINIKYKLIFLSKNTPVQSHSHSPKHLTSRLPSSREVWLARLVIANQVKWCDCPE